MSTKQVPWKFDDEGQFRTWMWVTEHFSITIRGDAHRYIYSVVDTSKGRERTVLDGFGNSFADATAFVLEFVGKAYPLKYGYRSYAGKHATTFRINTAEKIDFGPFEGSRVTIRVKDKTGNITSKSGLLQIENFTIVVVSDTGISIKVPPSFIVEVTPEGQQKAHVRVGQGRTVKGDNLKGCTGRLGFQAGTIEHGMSSPFCPIHQI